MPDKIARPFPVVLEVEFLDRLHEPVREGRAKSVSEIIRVALEKYDFENVVVMHPPQVQISVRLLPEIRRNLKKFSRAKHTSVGQLVRAAIESYLPQLEALAPPQSSPPAPKPRKNPGKRGAKKSVSASPKPAQPGKAPKRAKPGKKSAAAKRSKR